MIKQVAATDTHRYAGWALSTEAPEKKMRHDNHMIPYLFEQKLVLIVLRTQYLMNGAHHGNMRSFICSERSAIVAKGELEFGLPGFTGRNADQSSASSGCFGYCLLSTTTCPDEDLQTKYILAIMMICGDHNAIQHNNISIYYFILQFSVNSSVRLLA